MVESTAGDTASDATLERLVGLRSVLLRLHKTLLDTERATYEVVHGSVSSGELLQLVINHPQFAWLHPVSELIVRVDEMLDADEPLTTSEAESLLAQARALLKPSETGDEFGRKYFAAFQREPGAVLAHREVMLMLEAGNVATG
ncbi:MAG: hypothetical protein QOF61_1357 [Acidobacteriota bacterium]|nr:hypothetical protein [Acidobacteriota bacterium]